MWHCCGFCRRGVPAAPTAAAASCTPRTPCPRSLGAAAQQGVRARRPRFLSSLPKRAIPFQGARQHLCPVPWCGSCRLLACGSGTCSNWQLVCSADAGNGGGGAGRGGGATVRNGRGCCCSRANARAIPSRGGSARRFVIPIHPRGRIMRPALQGRHPAAQPHGTEHHLRKHSPRLL